MSKDKIYALPEKIKKVRSSKGIKQKDLAVELGFNYSWYNQAENASIAISEKRARKISDYLDTKFERLFSRKTTDNAPKPLTELARDLSSDAEIREFIKLNDFESVVNSALSMLERADSFWYGSGVTASWIKRNGVGETFAGQIDEAMDGEFDFKILLNNSPEVLLAEETGSRILFDDADKKKIDDLKERAEEKLAEYLEAYVDKVEVGEKILDNFKLFPHGDVRTFIADSNIANENSTKELLLVIDHPPIGGGHQRRWYSGVFFQDNELAKDYKYRFESIWDFSAYPHAILGRESPNGD